MRIKQISVKGLFGIFDHVIPLNTDDRITIIHAPNGFGKTVIMTMLNGFFNSQYSILINTPFKEFNIEFDNKSSMEIKKDINKANINFTFNENNSTLKTFILKEKILETKINFSVNQLDNIIPSIKQIDSNKWLDILTDEILSLEEVLERFNHLFPQHINTLYSIKEPDWLIDIKNNINIRLIESQRLLNFTTTRSSIRYDKSSSMIPTVIAYSQELAKLMLDKFKEYGSISQSLDRSFPARVVQYNLSEMTEEKLREQLNKLETNRLRLIEVGLLDQDENSDFQIQTQTIDESTKNILSLYIQDVEKKLDVFNDIADKIELFRDIINNKFSYSYKQINFNKDKGFIFTTGHNIKSKSAEIKTLSPNDLSSGEQHELVLLYELLFKVKPNSLVLIDEPELSLHVGWQVNFIKDLQNIIKLADLDILVATHSPDIIQDRWDLTVELKGVEN